MKLSLYNHECMPNTSDQQSTKYTYGRKKAKTEDLKKKMSDFSSNFTNELNKDTPIDILWSSFKNSCNELLN